MVAEEGLFVMLISVGVRVVNWRMMGDGIGNREFIALDSIT